tara:strand:+ start:71 stop:295 length:225 start_codon:yes stop_codon:yes gene_type:complete
MDLSLFILGGYGQFIWPAFIFTFVSCLILYLKTKKELQKQEKIFFSAYKELKIKKVEAIEEKKGAQEAFTTSSI